TARAAVGGHHRGCGGACATRRVRSRLCGLSDRTWLHGEVALLFVGAGVAPVYLPAGRVRRRRTVVNSATGASSQRPSSVLDRSGGPTIAQPPRLVTRTRASSLAAMNNALPAGSTATPLGMLKLAAIAGPPSPDTPDWPLPAAVVIACVAGSTARTR